MPKQTFFNLPQDKRDHIIALAVDEFAHNDYELASISKIVAEAGIAKGSFYQYFEDKLDLYQYLLSEGSRMKGEFLAQNPITADIANPFAYFRGLLTAGLRFQFAYPKLEKIAQKAMRGQNPLPAEWRQQVEVESLKFFSSVLRQGITSGYLRADLNVDVAAYIFYSAMRDMSAYVLQRLHVTSDDDNPVAVFAEHEAEVQAIFDELFNTLEHGMGVPKK